MTLFTPGSLVINPSINVDVIELMLMAGLYGHEGVEREKYPLFEQGTVLSIKSPNKNNLIEEKRVYSIIQ
jgi:hypothetical protein